jgi:hypothetical protein
MGDIPWSVERSAWNISFEAARDKCGSFGAINDAFLRCTLGK